MKRPLAPLLLVVLVVAGAKAAADDDAEVPYVAIVTGGEILSGAYADQHVAFLARTLRPLGLKCVMALAVDDSIEEIGGAVALARRKAGLVLVTGGLGPTENDITAEALSRACGVPLAENAEWLAAMEERTKTPRAAMRPTLRKQARTPVGGGYLKNPHGTAAGLVFVPGGLTIVALPGPPRELQPMVRDELVPLLVRRFGIHATAATLTLRFVGLGQSQISQTLADHAALAKDVIVGSQFSGSRVDYSFSLPAAGKAEDARLAALKTEILRHLGEYVYADDGATLEEAVIRQLAARQQRLVVAEIATGGELARGLAAAAGSGRVFAGGYAAVSKPALARLLGNDGSLAEMAAAAAARAGADWAIVAAEPTAGGAVEVAFRSPDGGCELQRIALRSGDAARAELATRVLDILRRRTR